MRSIFLSIFVIALPVTAYPASLCTYPGAEYFARKTVEIEIGHPDRDVDLVAYSTEPDFTIYAAQSDFLSLVKEWGEKQPHQQDFYDLDRWIESMLPSSVIYLELFDADHSEKRRYLMMELAEMGKVFVASSRTGRYLPRVKLEQYACMVGKYAERGGRKLVSESNRTVHWTSEWIL